MNETTFGPLAEQMLKVHTRMARKAGFANEADDIAMDVFTRLWLSCNKLNDELHAIRLGNLIWKQVVSDVIEARKRAANLESIDAVSEDDLPEDKLAFLADDRFDPARLLQQAELKAELEKYISRLKPNAQNVIRLKCKGLSSAEISIALSLSVPNVNVIVHRAKGKMLETLRDEHGDKASQ